MITDPVADMLTRIRNAVLARHEVTTIPYSRLKKSILNVLKEKGFLKEINVVKGEKFQEIKVVLDPTRKNIFLKRISTPGQRVYKGVGEIKPVLDGFGIAIISTSKGMMSDREAKKMSLGGEVVCEVW